MEKMTIEQLRNRPYKIPNNILRKGDNPKLSKHTTIEDLKKYWEMHLNLIPSNISGYETCASKSEGCSEACLHTSGNPVFMSQKNLGRLNRTLFYSKAFAIMEFSKDANNFVSIFES